MIAILASTSQALLKPVRQTELETDSPNGGRQLLIAYVSGPEVEYTLLVIAQVLTFAPGESLQDAFVVLPTLI